MPPQAVGLSYEATPCGSDDPPHRGCPPWRPAAYPARPTGPGRRRSRSPAAPPPERRPRKSPGEPVTGRIVATPPGTHSTLKIADPTTRPPGLPGGQTGQVGSAAGHQQRTLPAADRARDSNRYQPERGEQGQPNQVPAEIAQRTGDRPHRGDAAGHPQHVEDRRSSDPPTRIARRPNGPGRQRSRSPAAHPPRGGSCARFEPIPARARKTGPARPGPRGNRPANR